MSTLAVAIEKIEDHFRVCLVEYAHLFSPEGELKAYFRGSKDHVVFKSTEGWLEHTLTHNHPSGEGLSARDCCLLLETDLRELRAYGVDGVHILRKQGLPWRIKLDSKFEKQLQKILKKDEGFLEFVTRFALNYQFRSAPDEFREKNRMAAEYRRKHG